MMSAKTKYPRYQDYVIKDGDLIGEFEAMYRDFDDPWHQVAHAARASDKAVGIALLERLRQAFGVGRVVEIGCGLGQYTNRIAEAGFDAVGIDVSAHAIAGARERFPGIQFAAGDIADFDGLAALTPDVVVLSEITWYVLGALPGFLENLRRRLPDAFLLHMLVTYPPGVQSLGADTFTDLEGILRYFDMTYLEWGEACAADGHRRTYFLGTWQEERLVQWSAA